MTVRQALLAILDQGACYGYQLRAEYARRTAAEVNVGQVYTTLERLERDGLAASQGADERGHVYWAITEQGRGHVREWFASASLPAGRDELAHKVALAATLPGIDAEELIATQRKAAVSRIESVEEFSSSGGDVAEAIVRAAQRARARAEIEWLDAAAAVVSAGSAHLNFALSDEQPRRGRPRVQND